MTGLRNNCVTLGSIYEEAILQGQTLRTCKASSTNTCLIKRVSHYTILDGGCGLQADRCQCFYEASAGLGE